MNIHLPVYLTMLLAASTQAWALPSSNLVQNGSFDDAANPLNGWRTDYRADENRWYAGNHELVSTKPADGTRRDVLRINVSSSGLAQNQGVKVDSAPIPFDPGTRYRLSVWAGPPVRTAASWLRATNGNRESALTRARSSRSSERSTARGQAGCCTLARKGKAPSPDRAGMVRGDM